MVCCTCVWEFFVLVTIIVIYNIAIWATHSHLVLNVPSIVCGCIEASFPGLLRLHVLIACSMQKRREKAWGILHSMADITDSKCNSLFTFLLWRSYRTETSSRGEVSPTCKTYPGSKLNSWGMAVMQLQIVPSFISRDDRTTGRYFHACHSADFWSHVLTPGHVSYAWCSSLLVLVPSL